jgi:hypothetical protein
MPVIVLCVLAVAGCSSGGGGSATVSRGELGSTVLQAKDLGRGWSQFTNGKQVRADAHAGARADESRFHRVEGWIARYRRLASSAPGPAVVESRVDLFEATGGAEKDLGAYRDELSAGVAGSGATARLLPAPRVGEETVAGELRQGPLVFITVAWRRANASASVTIEGRAATTPLRRAPDRISFAM